ncbi:beta-ketoacyl-ACP synthase II [Roseivirga pacifica]|uniref:beta-ketoacyl-ACP synthase II n=1 Tax=Roseivirga pacifica TaxID=1267423 RepID=UPI002094D675|nr:beta-ketoacyl-ACP synthase II [Roseivirga pacifica]MCO6357993.1 beta-ketoacyl-ACP synthase II [Roseivirga pacifica]MCO6366432.1 beta-ketoacyl-ACP synthase II [Roseivirga pacifica]MCO6370917.1 beta-ketoacyl-ACP synthase II [Roseivirga pacifica]MCO6373725.1 beta-ketoacyl-ACP synthase II [Roseivirga pacifica]MCO6380706.1 beta-ketoacyl-ACP synthase II [Roseivirga pacifica]
MQLKRVVVTGLGALTPLGNNLETYWSNLLKGVSGAGPITRFDPEKFKTKFACEVKDYDPLNYFDRKEVRKMDLFTQYAMISSEEAIKDSGLDLEKLNREKAGVIWGSGIGGLRTFQEEVSSFSQGDGTPRFNPFFIPKMIADISAGMISIKYGFHGPNFVTVSACASATNAMIDAMTYIKLGKANVMITGGSEASVVEAGMGGFNAMKALSERNDSPETASRPFDKDRDGFVLGEGSGALILEEYEHAKARGAKIYAEVVGGGMSADAHHITAPHPEGLGAHNVMVNALEDAHMKPEEIDYINVHGTSTPLGDVSEVIAIERVFGEHAYNLNISSTKSMTGHLLGAAGAIEAIASVMAIKEQVVPPTINHFTDDERFDPRLNFTFNKAQKREVNAALSNTFGFGGHNTSVVFRKID